MKSDIYEPLEDSYLLAEALKNRLKKNLRSKKINENIRILDIGSGMGIQAEVCRELGFKKILTSDVNQSAVELLRTKGFKSVVSDLFEKIPEDEKFDLIIFNPPYLPEDKYDKKPDTTGGKRGYELALRFLKAANNFLAENGEILLLVSSFADERRIIQEAKKYYKIEILDKKRIFFEELIVILLRK